MPLVWSILVLLFAGRSIKSTTGQIYETESAYNYIQVLEQDGYRILRLNEGQGEHSMWHPTELDYHGPWEQFLGCAVLQSRSIYAWIACDSMAIVGLAAGTCAPGQP